MFLVDSRSGERVGKREVVSSKNCIDGVCNATLSSFYTELNGSYGVNITVSNGIQSIGSVTSDNNIGKVQCSTFMEMHNLF